jgi:hypothetical protein
MQRRKISLPRKFNSATKRCDFLTCSDQIHEPICSDCLLSIMAHELKIVQQAWSLIWTDRTHLAAPRSGLINSLLPSARTEIKIGDGIPATLTSPPRHDLCIADP